MIKHIKLFIKNNNLLRNIYLRINYRNELTLLNGNLSIKTQKNSIIHFSVNKSATQTVKNILTECAIRNNIIPIHWTNFAFNSKHPALCYSPVEEVKKYNHIFKEKGLFYSAFGGFVMGIPNLNRYKIILVIRDPRDILVSDYFSIAHSHLPPSKIDNEENYDIFMRRKNEALNSDIDTYVLNNMDRVFHEFERYQNHLLLNNVEKNILLLKYEDMISDFDQWLGSIVKFCEFENIDIEKLSANYEFKPRKENIKKHIRKGISGDYKNKLRKDTINRINERYSELLSALEYEL